MKRDLYQLTLIIIFVIGGVFNLSAQISDETSPEELKLPNAYIVNPGSSISIPIIKAYAIWTQIESLSNTNPDLSGNITAELLWQDNQSLISSVSIQGTAKTANINIVTNSNKGNAVIGLKIGGIIRYSWHIWVTDYDPKNQNIRYAADGEELFFMSTNLGATTDLNDNPESFGLLYQFGRKDPFPGAGSILENNYSNIGRTIYDIDNNVLDQGIKYEDVIETHNLANAIQNPLSYYVGNDVNGKDWYSSNPLHNDTLWCGTTGEKGVFDPSPEGWRIPPAHKMYPNLLNEAEQNISGYSMSGSRDFTNGLFFMTRDYGMYWSSTANNSLAYYMFLSDLLVQAKSSHYRSNGYSIRCIKDLNYGTNISNEVLNKSQLNVFTDKNTIIANAIDESYYGCFVSVYNTSGTLVAKTKILGSHAILASNVTAGLYLIKITGNNKYTTKVLVK
ncbi:T9SS C-terminal target domain-containing protein [Dysgonomonas sp. 216]|uniref:T9SS type A sorting domain-containing protein n=1 Tax=Dysgonomonas sp. 216 TaxID=2302934 RepID=UPI0013D586B8|nr:T9SS type A sorting domain-containing protein [Dysgonomonas sp. 216]NDW18259.1 T9SS C-terminal target domain-containing protein [Dysgonomonas sp. 216]NDW18627.1 T9SS C-terminal target domain-containing protein [Dysgonomonas sp. 216]